MVGIDGGDFGKFWWSRFIHPCTEPPTRQRGANRRATLARRLAFLKLPRHSHPGLGLR